MASTTGVRTTGKPIYKSPDLSVRDTLTALAESGITGLKEKDITEPKMEIVQRLYEQLMETLMAKSKEELNQAHFAGLSQLEHPVRSMRCVCGSPCT